MELRIARLGAAALVVSLAGGCGGDLAMSKPAPQPVDLTVWNYTHYALEQVRFHDGPRYLEAGNLLAEPLAHDGRVRVEFKSGRYVTVFRRNVDGGTLFAFTTAYGLSVPTDGYVLQVFQDAFRLIAPDLSDGGSTGEEQPIGGDPPGGGPSGSDPSGADPSGGDPFGGDP